MQNGGKSAMKLDPMRPLMVQSDYTVLFEVHHPDFEEVRGSLTRFAELVKSPENVHTYRITPLSLWNAAAAGMQSEEIVKFLERNSKFGLPAAVQSGIRKYITRFGLLRLEQVGHELYLVSEDTVILKELAAFDRLRSYLKNARGDRAVAVKHSDRGILKQELTRMGYPVQDLAGYHEGERLEIPLNERIQSFQLRDYQRSAVDSFYQMGNMLSGSGVLVLPCGAGKTVIGIAAMTRLHCATLILTTNVTSVRQWKREILEKTGLTEEQVGEYNGSKKEVRPVTIATYQILTQRKMKNDDFSHMRLFNERDWGLIIYDEVHLLPAPVFRATAHIQATRRLGLTATLVREDGREDDVFSLVGPKRYDIPWKDLEDKGWIARVECKEIRISLSPASKEQYAASDAKQKFRIAGENPHKLQAIGLLLKRHSGEPTIIIGQYLAQLHQIAGFTGAPMISGEMPHDERERLYNQFKSGVLHLLVVSKVANFAVDLPDAAVAIQVSGSYGSRQEEAQRLGRILRPKAGVNRAFFYSMISADTKEQDFAMKRQLFLIEQGYRYEIEEWDKFLLEHMEEGYELQTDC